MRSGHRVIEVSPEKEVVWSVGQYELPGIQLSWVATCTERPNGNIVISNCFAVNAAACKRSSLDWAGLLTQSALCCRETRHQAQATRAVCTHR